MTVSKDQNAPPSYDDAVNGGRVPTGLMSNGPYNVVSTLPPAVPPRVNSFEGHSGATAVAILPTTGSSPSSNSKPTKPLLTSNRFPSYTSISSPPFSPNAAPVYRYQNPQTGHVITTMLPPNHPAMQCLQEGRHQAGASHFGLCGILSAIVFFPVGIAMMLVDRHVVCDRCGEVLSEGC